MTNPIVFDHTSAKWPDIWPEDKVKASHHERESKTAQIFHSVTNYFHEKAAHHVLPSLDIKKEDFADLDQDRFSSTLSSDGRIKRAQFLTADNVVLDGAIIWNDKNDAEHNRYDNNHWILYFNGNGEAYEDNLDMLSWYAEETDCNIICFNYRGVGYSHGTPYHSSDLSLDGDAIFQFLLRQNVHSSDILIHARSLGGPVGTKVRSMHPDGPICNERSFDHWIDLERNFHGKVYTFFMGYYLNLMDWEFEPIKDWESIGGKKWIIVSPTDEIIDYQQASFYKKLKQAISNSGIHPTADSIQVIKLPEQYSWRSKLPEGHNIPLRDEEFIPCWEEHKKFVKECFK